MFFTDQELDGLPTSGVDGLALTLGDAPVARWEDALTVDDEAPVDSDLIELCFGDFDAMHGDGALSARAAEVFESESISDGAASVSESVVSVYVGEIAEDHRFYLGLDAAGQPAQLVAIFRYPAAP